MRKVSFRRYAAALFSLGVVASAAGANPTCTLLEPSNPAVRLVTESFTVRAEGDSDPAKSPADKPNGTLWLFVNSGTSTTWKKFVKPHTHGEGSAVARRKDSSGNDVDWDAGAGTANATMANVETDTALGVTFHSPKQHELTFNDENSGSGGSGSGGS